MQKQLQVFLMASDESRLSRLLKEDVPRIHFINDNVWPDTVDCRDGIESCDSGRVYLYQGDIQRLPTKRRKNGELEGPAAGCVVQVLRPRRRDGMLLSGRIAAGFDETDATMRRFVKAVWKCVREVGVLGVTRPDGRVDKNYLVGLDAKKLAGNGEIRIADRTLGIQYMPVD